MGAGEKRGDGAKGSVPGDPDRRVRFHDHRDDSVPPGPLESEEDPRVRSNRFLRWREENKISHGWTRIHTDRFSIFLSVFIRVYPWPTFFHMSSGSGRPELLFNQRVEFLGYRLPNPVLVDYLHIGFRLLREPALECAGSGTSG